MPLPADTTLSLQVNTNPGDPLHPKAKQAMVVRLSSETLDALEANKPKMQVVFGDTPGFFVNDVFFPMHPQREEAPHELYLRTSTAARPTTALKLYANITGKLQVGIVGRELGEKVENKVRERTLQAEEERTKRKTMMLDTPPDMKKPTFTKKKEQQTMFRKPIQQPDPHRSLSATNTQQTRLSSPRVASAPSGSQSARVSSPLPSSSRDNDLVSSTRARLIHFVAIHQNTAEEAVKMVGGKDCDPAKRREILQLLEEVAEHVPAAKGSTEPQPRWQLKNISWTEVRPYEWASIGVQVRLRLARLARAAFSILKIPESDPVWEHARYRGSDNYLTHAGLASSSVAARASSPDTTTRVAKKGIIATKGTKQKKSDGPKRNGDIFIAKDEGSAVAREVTGKGKAREVESTPQASSPIAAAPARPPARRLPGSGYKAPKTESLDGTPGPTPATREQSPLPKRVLAKKSAPTGVGARKKEPVPSGSTRPVLATSPTSAAQQAKPKKGAVSTAARLQRKPKAPSPLAEEITYDDEDYEAEKKPKKRKKPARDEDSDYSDRDEPLGAAVQKKRKVATTKVTKNVDRDGARERGRVREREIDEEPTVQKKPVKRPASPMPPPRPKIKKEESPASPMPRRTIKKEESPAARLPAGDSTRPSSSASSYSRPEQPRRSSGSAKPRRRSPVYTSTSSENGSPEPPAKYKPRFRPRATPLPSDHEALRRYYRACWTTYIALYAEKASFIKRSEKRLQEGEAESLVASDSESDSPLSSMDLEVAKAFAADLQAVEAELQKITRALGTGSQTSASE